MSETYKALYRKWRPSRFGEVVGQNHISDTLKNSVLNSRISHAYLFCGTRGTGKTSIAKIFSRAVNCLNNQDGEPCNECSACVQALKSSSVDICEFDAASNNGIDNIRDILSDAVYAPASSKYKVYIIDEVHMLSTGAFNALLKTLEEPPSHVIFILATTEPHKIPPTILSRCQRFDFRRIGISEISKRMEEITNAEGINITPDAVELISELADGSMRDGLSILEQCTAFSKGTLTYDDVVDIVGIVDLRILFKISESIINNDCSSALTEAGKFLNAGKEAQSFLEDLITHFRNLLICKSTDNPDNLLEKNEESTAQYKAQSETCSTEFILYCISTFSEYLNRSKVLSNPNIAVETSLIKACKPEYSTSNEALLARIEKLERIIASGNFQAAPSSKKVKSNSKSRVKSSADLTESDELSTDDSNETTNNFDSANIDEYKPWSLWSEALPIIKNESKTLFAFLYAAKALDRGDTIELVLRSQVAYDRIATQSGIKYLSELFSKVNESPLSVKVSISSDDEALNSKQSKRGTRGDKKPSLSIMDIANKKELFGDKMNIIVKT